MLLKIAGLVAAIPVALLGLFGATGILIVDVQEGGANGHHFMVPVPLLVAQTAASFAPAHAMRLNAEEARLALPIAEEVLAALADAPDAELVRVEERNETVIVRKVGDTLEVRVNNDREAVNVNLPISVAREVLRNCRGGQIRPAEIVGALRQARFTDLVDVRDGHDRVHISVW